MKSEDAAIRRANLQYLCNQRSWTPTMLSDTLGWGRDTYWRDLLGDPNKSFGEKAARRIEDKLELGRGWLDEPQGTHKRSYVKAHEREPAAFAGNQAPSPLPFSAELIAALQRCDRPRLIVLENTLRALLELPPLADKRNSRRA